MNELIKVLFLDDDVDFRDQRIDQLEILCPGRLIFFPVATREVALSIISEEDINVAIVDIFMADNKPGGIEVAREASRNGICTIIYSGKEAKGYRPLVQEKNTGPVIFVKKTGDIEDLRPHVERFIVQHDILRASLENALQDQLISHHFGWRLGTMIAVRFQVGDVTLTNLKAFRENTTPREAEQLWRLTYALNALTRIIRQQQGDVLTLGGRVAVIWFSDETDGMGLRRAVKSLKLLADESVVETDRVWHSIRFSAGLLPGRYSNGLFGQRLPGHAAIVSPLFDIVVALANGTSPMTVATLSDWMKPVENELFALIGTQLDSISATMPEPSMGIVSIDRRQII
jgi:hypothetical protein